MKIAVPKERRAHEKRVAASPETVRKLTDLGVEVVIEAGAGIASQFTDDAYVESGASIAADPAAVYSGADVVFKVQRPMRAGEGDVDELSLIPANSLLLALLAPYEDADGLAACAANNITAFALELVPRISRAQSMDVLSSQSNLAGYRAVIDAAAEFSRGMPMMMTAAGSVAPAKVLVMGAGVAGLQAIATARRLGAVVSATDVRIAAKEQVESLGGKFVMVDNDEAREAETAGGYAKEMSDDYKRAQAELIAETIKAQDIVICTALIPGRKAPQLVSEEMLLSMQPGSVIIDLAVEQGGNCARAEAGKVVDVNGVKIVGHYNVPSRIATDASRMYAKNLYNFITLLLDDESAELNVNWEDEVVAGALVTRDGSIVNPALAGAN